MTHVLDHTHIGQVVAVHFLERVRDPEVAAKKQRIVDVRCRDQEGREYIVEMQVAKQPGFEKRAQYYAAKAYSRQLLSGEEYDQLKEVIFIAITDYVVFPEKAAIKSDHLILDKQTQAHDLKDLYFTFIELPKFNKRISELASGLDYWCYYLKHAPETKPADYDRLIRHSPIIHRAYAALDQYYWSEAELNTYEAWVKSERDSKGIERQKLLDAEARGMEKGREEGREEEKVAIAKQMLAKGLDTQFISELTGLSEEQLKQLTP